MTQPAIIISYILAAIAAYLLSSISFSIIFSKWFSGADVRTQGSGNAGATNVLRTVGKFPAILTFICDFLKCVAAILIAILLAHLFHLSGEYSQYIKYTTAIVCLIGHIFPLYFGFKGGKGVTPAAAVMLLLDWRCFLIGIGIFIVLVLISRIVSLSSIIAASSIPFTTFLFQTADQQKYALVDAFLVAVIALIIIVRHRANISRLLKGTEPRIHSK